MNDKTNNQKSAEKSISSKILVREIVTLIIYIVSLSALMYLGKFLFSLRTWYGDESIYKFFHPLSEYSSFLLFILIIIGAILIVIFFYYYRIKMLGYFKNVIEGTKNIYNDTNDIITLPPELKEIEMQMNQIKMDIREAQRAAKEAEQKKNDLVVYLAHDLKTPLTSVIGYLTLLRDEQQISPELREKYLSISLNKAERLEDLINEFFEITRFNLTNLTLEPSRINLTRMLEQLIFEFEPMLSEKRLKCELLAPPDLNLKIDADKMQRVFDNLLRNAVNYSFEENIIEIAVRQKDNSINIKFSNHGNTIPKEKLERIFEQFYRLDTARTTKSGGAGLGLAIAKEIVELHNGTITASSENETITFEVEIPMS